MKQRGLWVVAVPFVIFTAWVGQIYVGYATGGEAVLAIEGFDPRDLLSGHYLRYRVAWGQPLCSEPTGRDHCVCLDDSVPAAITWNGRCGERPTGCRMFVRGHCQGSSFEAGLNRFYFPEAWQGKLVRVPPKATLTLALTPQGEPIVKSMDVDGVPLQSWIEQQSTESP